MYTTDDIYKNRNKNKNRTRAERARLALCGFLSWPASSFSQSQSLATHPLILHHSAKQRDRIHINQSSIQLRLKLILVDRDTLIRADPTQLLIDILLHMAVRLAFSSFLLPPLLGELFLVPECVTVADGRAVAPVGREAGIGRAVERVVADGAGGGRTAETGCAARGGGEGGLASTEVAAREGVVEIVRCGDGGGAWGLGQAAVDSMDASQ